MNQKTILLTAIPVGIVGIGALGYYLIQKKKKEEKVTVTVELSPADTIICTDQTITVTAKTGLGTPIANAPGILTPYIEGQKGRDYIFTTREDGTWSGSMCWQSGGHETVPTTRYESLSYVVTVAGATGTGNGRIVYPQGTVLPCNCA